MLLLLPFYVNGMEFEYDLLGRLTVVFNDDKSTKQVYSYDINDNLASRRTVDVNRDEVSISLNGLSPSGNAFVDYSMPLELLWNISLEDEPDLRYDIYIGIENPPTIHKTNIKEKTLGEIFLLSTRLP